MIEYYQNDKSTIFSIVPFAIVENKPGLYPGHFDIPACLDDSKPVVFTVGASEHLMHTPDSIRPTRLVTPSFEIARSIITDFYDGQLWTTPEAQPGLAWVQGEVNVTTFKTLHKSTYNEMLSKQRAWFVNLCKQTDNEWTRSKNTRVVSDQARFGARLLGLEPEWLNSETVGLQYNRCASCQTPQGPHVIVCPVCRCILNKEKYKELQFAS